MRILLVDISLSGHRQKYIEALLKLSSKNIEIQVLVPKTTIKWEGCSKIHSSKKDLAASHTFSSYLSIILQIRKIVKTEKIDIVHFLCGDAFYRFFGVGLNLIPAKRVITYHHVVLNSWRRIAIKSLCHGSKVGIVHTQSIQSQFIQDGLQNVQWINYPMLDMISSKDQEITKKYYDLPLDRCIIGSLGGTSFYKGLDLLIQALNNVKTECCLFVAGSKADFDEDYIKKNLQNERVLLKTVLRRLSEEELADAMQAVDIMVLPYRREFDGASGILIDSVFHGKPIIGANHGSMGSLIREYGLGRTFETESVESLRAAIEAELKDPFEKDSRADKFISLLSKEVFVETHRKIYQSIMEEKQ